MRETLLVSRLEVLAAATLFSTGGAAIKAASLTAEMRLPIYLDADVQDYLAKRAAQKGMPLGEMVNGLLKQEIQIIESVK